MPSLLICLRTVYSLLENRTSCQDLASRLSSLSTSFLMDRHAFRKPCNVSEVDLVANQKTRIQEVFTDILPDSGSLFSHYGTHQPKNRDVQRRTHPGLWSPTFLILCHSPPPRFAFLKSAGLVHHTTPS